MNYRDTNIKCFKHIITTELYNLLSVNIEPCHIEELKVTKLRQMDGEMKYVIHVKKIYAENESFVNHAHYIKQSVSREFVDSSDSASMEDLSIVTETYFANIFFEITETYHGIAQAIIDNDFLKIDQMDLYNVKDNETLYNSVYMYIKVQTQIAAIDRSIGKFMSNLN